MVISHTAALYSLHSSSAKSALLIVITLHKKMALQWAEMGVWR